MKLIGNDETVIRDDERGIIQLFHVGESIGDSVEGTSIGGIDISIENPWAGNSASGFGQSTYINLTPEAAKALGEWLIWAASKQEG